MPTAFNTKRFRSSMWVIFAFGVLAHILSAQSPPKENAGDGAKPSLLLIRPLPERLDGRMQRLGKRLTTPGRELISVAGTLTQGSSTAEITVVWQLPGVFVVSENGGTGRTISFAGGGLKNSKGQIGKSEQQMLDALVLDWPESLFTAVDQGMALRFLGNGFKPAPGSATDGSAPDLDLYQIGPPTAAAEKLGSLYQNYRLMGFDSKTGMLAVVRHTNENGDVMAEMRFSNWKTTDGENFPGDVSYQEDGRETLHFTLRSFAVGPMQQAAGGQQ